MPIVYISAIRYTESKNVCLVACTQFGMRLYFSLNEFTNPTLSQQQQQQQQHQQSPLQPQHMQQQQQPQQGDDSAQTESQKSQQQQQAPSLFQLIHVRIPPNIELSTQNRAGPISSAYASNGVTLLVSKRDEHTDSVLLLNRDLFLLHSNYKEAKTMFDINGRIWCVEEIVPALSSIRQAALDNDVLQTATSAAGVKVPKLTAEYFDLPRRFAMITPQGCFVWNKLRPIDQFSLVLKESNGPNSESVRLFFNKIYEVVICSFTTFFMILLY